MMPPSINEPSFRGRSTEELLNLLPNISLNAWFTCSAVRNEQGTVSDMTITRINASFTRIVGRSEKEVVGKPFLSVLPAAWQQGLFDLGCEVLRTGALAQRLVRHGADKQEAWYDTEITRLGPDSLLINFADISIIGKAPYGVFQYRAIYDEKGNVVDFVHHLFNEVAMQLSAFSFEELSTKTAYELCVARKNTGLFNRALEVMKKGTS